MSIEVCCPNCGEDYNIYHPYCPVCRYCKSERKVLNEEEAKKAREENEEP